MRQVFCNKVQLVDSASISLLCSKALKIESRMAKGRVYNSHSVVGMSPPWVIELILTYFVSILGQFEIALQCFSCSISSNWEASLSFEGRLGQTQLLLGYLPSPFWAREFAPPVHFLTNDVKAGISLWVVSFCSLFPNIFGGSYLVSES